MPQGDREMPGSALVAAHTQEGPDKSTRWRRDAVLVTRDPDGFRTFFDSGPGSRYSEYRIAAVTPHSNEQVLVVLEREN